MKYVNLGYKQRSLVNKVRTAVRKSIRGLVVCLFLFIYNGSNRIKLRKPGYIPICTSLYQTQ